MLDTLIFDLSSTSKPAEKQKVLLANDSPFLKYILKATYKPFELYHVKLTSKDIPPTGELTFDLVEIQEEFKVLLNFCKGSNSSAQNKIKITSFLSKLTEGSQKLALGVLNKNWKAGVSESTINKAFPDLISVFEVQLSNSYNKSKLKKSFQRKARLCSDKLDGVRGVWLRIDGEWLAYSRQGKQFLTVGHMKPDLEKIYNTFGYSFFDGEFHVDGLVFEDVQSLVTSFTKGTAEELNFKCFIVGNVEDFLKQDGANFIIFKEEYGLGSEKILELKQELIGDDQVYDKLEDAFERGVEGIMLRDPDCLYDFKRSDSLLKLKESDSDNSQEGISDALVVDMLIDDFPVIINETIVYKKLVTKIVVEQKNGVKCKVGSGFTLDFRYKCTEDPSLILGKVVEIEHQGYGKNNRMRFPRLFRIREDLTWGQ